MNNYTLIKLSPTNTKLKELWKNICLLIHVLLPEYTFYIEHREIPKIFHRKLFLFFFKFIFLTNPPVNPMVTTKNFVHNGHSKNYLFKKKKTRIINIPNFPIRISTCIFSIKTHNDQSTHVTAIKINAIEHIIFLLSTTFISNFCH